MTSSINNDQPSIVLNQVVVEYGIYPSYGGSPGTDPVGIPIGAIRTFATYTAGDSDYPYAQPAQGQLLSINQKQALFSLVGISYGGNGRQNFGLPNLAGTVAVGAGSGPSGPLIARSCDFRFSPFCDLARGPLLRRCSRTSRVAHA